MLVGLAQEQDLALAPGASGELPGWFHFGFRLESPQAVRDYLVGTGGLSASQVRTVSYGEDRNRQVHEGATGEAGRYNRRVSLVVDYAGPAQANTAAL